MKRTLLFLSILAGTYGASAQCTPDASVTSGISSDTVQNLAVSYVGQSYSQVVTFKVPTDTTYLGANVTISHIKLDAVVGLPANYTYTCNPSNCQFPGGSLKCVDLHSTTNPTLSQVGSYPVTIQATPYILLFGSPSATPQVNYDGYYLIIAEQTPVSVQKVESGDMKSLIAYPNPTSGNTTIEYGMGYNSEVKFTVTNLVGSVISSQVYSATRGLNTIKFDASNVPNGVYLYTITDGKNTISKKLIVSK